MFKRNCREASFLQSGPRSLDFRLPGASPGFPNRPLRIIVAFTPGNCSDTPARLYGRLLEKELGQPVIVENRPGANCLQALKAAPAGGYTIGMGGAFLVVNPVVIKDVHSKPSEFHPVAGIVSGQ